jgi:hypothetical protein
MVSPHSHLLVDQRVPWARFRTPIGSMFLALGAIWSCTALLTNGARCTALRPPQHQLPGARCLWPRRDHALPGRRKKTEDPPRVLRIGGPAPHPARAPREGGSGHQLVGRLAGRGRSCARPRGAPAGPGNRAARVRRRGGDPEVWGPSTRDRHDLEATHPHRPVSRCRLALSRCGGRNTGRSRSAASCGGAKGAAATGAAEPRGPGVGGGRRDGRVSGAAHGGTGGTGGQRRCADDWRASSTGGAANVDAAGVPLASPGDSTSAHSGTCTGRDRLLTTLGSDERAANPMSVFVNDELGGVVLRSRACGGRAPSPTFPS